jgi:hypothetical protein
MHIFDHTVKPVLLYASEIVGLFNKIKMLALIATMIHILLVICTAGILWKN